MTRRALVAACSAAVAILVAGAPRARAQDSGIEVGTHAPAAAVQTLEGRPADLSSVIGARPAVLEFWAVWCPNCRELEPVIRALHARYGSRVQFVGVAVSANQSAALVKKYVAKHGIPWTQFYDTHGRATGAYDVPATSYVVVVDRAGKVVYTGLGASQPGLEAAIRRTL